MKRLLILAIVIVAAIIGYKTFLGARPASAEESALQDLERDLESARQEFLQAGRAAGLSGVDTASTLGAVVSQVKRIDKRLQELTGRLASAPARDRAERLARQIDDLKRQMGL